MIKVVRTAGAIALIALVLATLANVAGFISTVYVIRDNCHDVELVKGAIRAQLEDDRTALTNGSQDVDLILVYHGRWEEVKQNMIDRLDKQLERFDPQKCPLIPWER